MSCTSSVLQRHQGDRLLPARRQPVRALIGACCSAKVCQPNAVDGLLQPLHGQRAVGAGQAAARRVRPRVARVQGHQGAIGYRALPGHPLGPHQRCVSLSAALPVYAGDSINRLHAAAILLQPIVPDSARKILDYLAVPEAKRSLAQASLLADDPAAMGVVLSNAKSFVAFPKIQK